MSLAPAVNTLRRATEQALTLPPAVNVWQWAEMRRRLSKEVSPITGFYRVAAAPFQREMQESFTDPDVQVTVFCMASRLGKTEVINNLIGYKVEFDPSNILFCWPTIDRAKIWSKQILAPAIRSTPALRDRFRETRSKDADNTILSKRFPGGTLSAIGSNSPSGFRGTQAPTVIGDEADGMENNLEGDPILLLFKRAENHPDSTQIVSSSPTLKGASRIWSWLERSDFRKWFVPCHHCGEFIVLHRDHLRYPDGQTQKAEYECNACAKMLNAQQRFDMVMAGKWMPTQPFNGIRGYWLNGMNSPFAVKKGYTNKLHQFAAEIEEHKAQGEEAMITLTNTFDAECYEMVSQSASAEELFARCEEYPVIPSDVLMLTVGADEQEDRIEALCVGWGAEEQAWCIEHRVFNGNTEQNEVHEEFDQWLMEIRTRADGLQMKIAQAFLDSGFNSKTVYAFTRKREHRKVFASKGVRFGPLCTARPSRRNEQNAGVFIIGTNSAKTSIFHRLKIKENGPRKIHYPKGRGFTEDWFEQFTAEHLVLDRVNGMPAYVWKKKDENARNEALDCYVGAFAAMAQMRPNWAAVKERLEKIREAANPPKEYVLKDSKAAPEPAAAQKPEPKPFVRTPRRVGGFVGGWKR